MELSGTDQLDGEESLSKAVILVFDIIKVELSFLPVAIEQDHLPLGDAPGL